MNLPKEWLKPDHQTDRRDRYRSKELGNPTVVISFAGGPIYQLKIRDLSYEGAGIVVRADSQFLKRVEIGRELKIRVLLPGGYQGPSGFYRSRVEHITEILDGPFKGHLIVGISFIPSEK